MTALTKLLSSKGEFNYPDQTITVEPPSFYIYSNGAFGYSVDISDTYAIVGAYNTGSGSAVLYNAKTGEYIRSFLPNVSYSNGRWGWSVAVSDNYAIVGGPQHQVYGTYDGYAAIFNPATGARLHNLYNPNPYSSAAYDNFGWSVDISDNYAIVSAYGEDDAQGSSSGKVYIFNPATGARLHILDNPNPYGNSNSDNFGYSVAITNNYAIVSAPYEDEAFGTDAGKAYIFDPATGALLHTLDNPNAFGNAYYDYFGYSVAISDNYAIVGARGESDAEGSSSGKAYIFDTATGALLHTLDNPNAFGTTLSDYFGNSVAISNDQAIVGAYGEDESGGTTSGVAYVFDLATGALLHTLKNSNAYSTPSGDYFGWSVAISNNQAIVGAYNEDHPNNLNAGKAYIFVDL